MRPSVGRIVHYLDPITGECCAAMVVRVSEVSGQVSLRIWTPNCDWNVADVSNDEDQSEVGTWHWPERVE